MSNRTLLYIPLLFILSFAVGTTAHSQTAEDTLAYYRQAFENVKATKEFKDYMLWTEEEVPYISNEILYGSELLFDCPKCETTSDNDYGVKSISDDILSQEDREDYKAILFFTEIKKKCFAVILKTTFNNQVLYNDGVFVGKQAFFQFIIEDDQISSCFKMTLKNN